MSIFECCGKNLKTTLKSWTHYMRGRLLTCPFCTCDVHQMMKQKIFTLNFFEQCTQKCMIRSMFFSSCISFLNPYFNLLQTCHWCGIMSVVLPRQWLLNNASPIIKKSLANLYNMQFLQQRIAKDIPYNLLTLLDNMNNSLHVHSVWNFDFTLSFHITYLVTPCSSTPTT